MLLIAFLGGVLTVLSPCILPVVPFLFAGVDRTRTATWQPDGAGYSTLTVIDAAGRAASVKVFVQ